MESIFEANSCPSSLFEFQTLEIYYMLSNVPILAHKLG